jgi:hypothetical protein
MEQFYHYNKETKTFALTGIKNSFQEYDLNNIPEETEIIKIGDYFNYSIDILSKFIHLTKLSIGFDFNQLINNLPLSLTHLSLGYHFNQPVDNLPNKLTHLIFHTKFNQPVDNLPLSLTHLILGNEFNQKIDNLPNNLIFITFGYNFNQSLVNLPKSVKKLNIYINNKNINLVNNLPEHIEILSILFCNYLYRPKIDNLPITLKEIYIENKISRESINIPFGTIVKDYYDQDDSDICDFDF